MVHSYKGQDRRTSLRFAKNYNLFYHFKDSSNSKSDVTIIKDISKGGVCFTTSKPIDVGSQLVFEIAVSYIAPQKLILEGIVVVSKEITPGLVYEIRAKFNPVDEKTSQLFDMIEKRNHKGS